MSRRLLERIRDFARENYPVQMNGLIAEISIELSKPEPRPDYWHVVGADGESIITSSWEELCHEHINDALAADLEEARTWVVRPLWSGPSNV